MKKQSKNVWKILLLTMLLVSTMIITASAATASKVTYKRTYTNSKESVTIWGKTSSGKTVWTYRSVLLYGGAVQCGDGQEQGKLCLCARGTRSMSA